jgi:hypothetical protein
MKIKGTITYAFDYDVDPEDYGADAGDPVAMVKIDLDADELGFIGGMTIGDAVIRIGDGDDESSRSATTA